MSFDVAKWNKKRYLAEAGIEENKSKYDEYLDIIIGYLKDANGADAAAYLDRMRNFITNKMSNVDSTLDESADNSSLEKEFDELFNFRAGINQYGITIYRKDDISDDTFEEMIKWAESKGYKVDRDQSNAWYDYDPGERDYYPRIKFAK
jgi:hypothetical protein